MFWAGLARQLGQPAGGRGRGSGRAQRRTRADRRVCRAGQHWRGHVAALRGAGAGKTALLDAAAGTASDAGILVLRAAGVEFEADLAFSGLHQVLLPLLDEFGQLSAAHRDALNVALGYGKGPPPDRLLVSTAALTVLRQAAAARPVLMIIDDLPWLDRASAGVLAFVAGRLAGSRVGFLAASRPGQESFFERAGLPRHELGPLDEEAASDLVSSRFPDLAPRVRQRVVAEARGNPLALLELPAALSGAQRAAAEALPVVLPLSRRLQALFASRASALPHRPAGCSCSQCWTAPETFASCRPPPGRSDRRPRSRRAGGAGERRRSHRPAGLPPPADPVRDRGAVRQRRPPPGPPGAGRPAGGSARTPRLASG